MLIFNIPLFELSSNKDDYTDTKAIITTNIGVQNFDALWIRFYLHIILKIEKPIIVILNQKFCLYYNGFLSALWRML